MILRLKRIGKVIEDQPPELLGCDEVHILAIYSRGVAKRAHMRAGKNVCMKEENLQIALCRTISDGYPEICEMALADIMADVENGWLVEAV